MSAIKFESKLGGGKLIHSQSREIIANTLKFMRKESDAGGHIIPLQKVVERVAACTGVSSRTVCRITVEKGKIEAGESSKYDAPKQRKRRRRFKKDGVGYINDFNKGVLKRLILFMYTTDKIAPTLRTILTKFSELTGYSGSRESLRILIKTIGFRWTNRNIWMERSDIQKHRLDYLRAIKNYREAARPIIFLGETYIYSPNTTEQAWNDDSDDGLSQPVATGQRERLIIVNAGGENGFISNSTLILKSNRKTDDYHNDMNLENFSKWVLEKLIPNLPSKSVVVIDNAYYHDVEIDKAPTSSSNKETMREWLTARNITVDESLLKADLYELIKRHKPRCKKYAIDEIFLKHKHNVLRLPRYHPDLNPIELVWASLKEYIIKRNTTFRLNEMYELCENFFQNFPVEEWRSLCEHSKKNENDFLARERKIDEVMDGFEIDNDDDSEDTDNSYEFDETEDL